MWAHVLRAERLYARTLRDQLIEQRAIAGDGFVPLAAVVPAAEAGR